MERECITQALEETEGVQIKAAGLLRISGRGSRHRVKKLDVDIMNTRGGLP